MTAYMTSYPAGMTGFDTIVRIGVTVLRQCAGRDRLRFNALAGRALIAQ
jgi:hypothetical protein